MDYLIDTEDTSNDHISLFSCGCNGCEGCKGCNAGCSGCKGCLSCKGEFTIF